MEKIRVGDLGKIVTGKTPRTNISENYGGKIPFLTPTDDLSPMKCQKTINTLTELGLCEVKNCLLPSKSICVSCIGSDMGHVIMTSQPTVTNQQFNSIIPLEEYNPEYVYYLMILRGKLMKSKFGKSSTAVPIVSKSLFSSFEIYVYKDKDRQKAISNVLANIDEKITLNTRMNAELEAMAKQLYDYWFVQFNFPDENGKPYKSSGGKMVYNSTLKREIPEGWEVRNLFYIANYYNGLACQNYRPKEGEDSLPVIKITEMHNGFTSETEKASTNIPSEAIIENGDVLFAWSASLEVMLWGLGKGALNQHIFKVTSNNGFPKSFYYFQLMEYVGHFKKIAEAKKTTMGHITKDHLEQSKIVVPLSYDLPNKLEEKIAPLLNKIVSLSSERIYLTHLRDSLLPMLMNGQIIVE